MQGRGLAVSQAAAVQREMELDGYPTLFRGLFLTFRSRGVGREEAQDLAQETIVRTLVHLRRHGRSAVDLGPLVRTIGRNLFIERIRRAKPEVVELSDTIVDDAPEPQELVVQSEQREEVRTALRSLTTRHRHVVELWMQGLTPGQIARELGIKRNAADAILHRARRRLASLLEESRGAFVLIGVPIARLRVAFRSAAQSLASVSPGSVALAPAGLSLATVALAAMLFTAQPVTRGHQTPFAVAQSSSAQGALRERVVTRDPLRVSAAPAAAIKPQPAFATTDVDVRRQDVGVEIDPGAGNNDDTGAGINRADSGGKPGKVGSALDHASSVVCGGASVCGGNN
jgi:RNA polymerase sigma factor (sigma-70 family)